MSKPTIIGKFKIERVRMLNRNTKRKGRSNAYTYWRVVFYGRMVNSFLSKDRAVKWVGKFYA